MYSVGLRQISYRSAQSDTLIWQDISGPGKDFVRRLLEKDPRKRMRVTEALAHPWVCVLHAAPSTRLSTVVVERLVAFTRSSRLERALLNLVAKHLSRSDIGHLEGMFKALDTDGDGCAPMQIVKHVCSTELDTAIVGLHARCGSWVLNS